MKVKTVQQQIDDLGNAFEFLAKSLYGNTLSERAVMKILEYTDKRAIEKPTLRRRKKKVKR